RPPNAFSQIGLLAIGEVALVEQAHLGQAAPAGEHERAVGVAGGFPSGAALGGDEDAAEVAVDDRLGGTATAVDGAGQAGTWPIADGGQKPAQTARSEEHVVRCDHRPVAPPLVEPTAEADVGRGTEA